jgi:hypothetical protein
MGGNPFELGSVVRSTAITSTLLRKKTSNNDSDEDVVLKPVKRAKENIKMDEASSDIELEII